MAEDVTGSWMYRGPSESGIWLKTVQQAQRVRFQLELQRGAPSYNSGWIEGEFDFQGNLGVFSAKTEDGLCKIAFKFSPTRVEIEQLSDEVACGFGHGVFAQGGLRRESRKKPKFSKGDPRHGN